MAEELGIIENPGFGMRDCSEPVLWFDVRTLNGNSLQVFGIEQTVELIKDAHVYRVQDLHGKTCAVERANGLMKFLRMVG